MPHPGLRSNSLGAFYETRETWETLGGWEGLGNSRHSRRPHLLIAAYALAVGVILVTNDPAMLRLTGIHPRTGPKPSEISAYARSGTRQPPRTRSGADQRRGAGPVTLRNVVDLDAEDPVGFDVILALDDEPKLLDGSLK